MRFSPAGLATMLFVIASFVLSSPSFALDAGATAAPIHAPSVLGGKALTFDLQDALRHHAVVLYFFPKAFSQG